MTLLARYQELIQSKVVKEEVWQADILTALEERVKVLSLPSFLWYFRATALKDVYLYGPVGVGKTFLMDVFFEAVPIKNKLRIHFHQWMQMIDAMLRDLQGEKNPIQKIAKHFTRKLRLLCLDELLVEDPAHAMILAELFQLLLASRVMLCITSNQHPDHLYEGKPHRMRFLPTIQSIKEHCELLTSQNFVVDHRLMMTVQTHQTYWELPKDMAVKSLKAVFDEWVKTPKTGVISLQRRDVPVISYDSKIIWFDFNVICNTPRCQLDYLEIAERFDTVFMSHLPKLSEKDVVRVVLFIRFVDVMYDRGVRLFLTADVSVDALYVKGEWLDSFKRTKSRLIEMQSKEYLLRHVCRK